MSTSASNERSSATAAKRYKQKIVQSFQEAHISLTLIWNYDPNIFYNIPQTTRQQHSKITSMARHFNSSSPKSIQTTTSCMTSGCTTTTIGYKKLATSPT
ncbi:hypothetical protein VP01_248g5 [Puccinia sorghi]|uniref:Uncharacterized protein n=1 Tax=Puccinia sorghi TaxID=27349 RepID=A0A0L6V5U8_9BASI|nr:hypothetical protein VP01_248g5 [Puccinia sorghi]